jgi:hypothetical protein
MDIYPITTTTTPAPVVNVTVNTTEPPVVLVEDWPMFEPKWSEGSSSKPTTTGTTTTTTSSTTTAAPTRSTTEFPDFEDLDEDDLLEEIPIDAPLPLVPVSSTTGPLVNTITKPPLVIPSNVTLDEEAKAELAVRTSD